MIDIRSQILEHPIFKREMMGVTCGSYVGNESLGKAICGEAGLKARQEWP
jgi:hypothetical protein